MINIVYKPKIEGLNQVFQYQTMYSAGADLIAQKAYEITPGQTIMIKTGVFVEGFSLEGLEPSYIPELQVRPRSGLSKKGILASFGTVDCDYRDEIGVILTNTSDRIYYITPGDRIAQLVCAMVYRPKCIAVAQVVREGGWGHTGQ
jgi:dUTP pyrophosphatase